MTDLNTVLKGIQPVDKEAMEKAQQRLDNLVKPIGSLGKLEEIAVKLSGITGELYNCLEKKCTVVMAADNGIHEEGVSACPQAITAIQTINFLKGITGINVLSKHANADIRIVDIGVNSDLDYPGLISRKIRKGTFNMAKGSAMSREEAVKGLETGIEVVEQLVKEGYKLLGTGEMGICNTSTSSAIVMSFTGCSAEEAVGKGAGLTDEDYKNKKRVISKAVDINKPDKNDAIDVLSKVGGFDIAGLAGCFLGAAFHRIPIVIDGFISTAAALIAYKLNPLVRDYMFASHCSEEPGYMAAIKELGLEPALNLNMRLGEGTGCPLMFNIIEASQTVIKNMATFEEASIKDDFLVDIRE
ncbi:MAG: nicotinate-nucleotide--dimethylbenzimidazole phosphoribosyltransferase [Bacillota bacterium]